LRTHADGRRRIVIRPALLAVAGVVLAVTLPAEARSPTGRAAQPEVTHDAAGFTISQNLRVSGSVREDYEAAAQLLQRQQYEQGIALLIKVTEAVPDAIAPHIDLGMAYARTSAFEQAETSLKRALAIDPGHPIANNELGMLYRRTGRFVEARARYEKALELYPGFHYARRNLAILCDLYLQDFNCALQQYDAYRQAVPDDPETVKWIADVRGRAGRGEAP
jgi:Flp pilus assembly protein TadD